MQATARERGAWDWERVGGAGACRVAGVDPA